MPVLRAWIAASALDRRLAAGEPPEGDRDLTRRARRLTSARRRRALACGLRRALHAAGSSTSARSVALDGYEILVAHRELELLVRRLEEPRAVAPAGMARVQLLVTDPCSPLYVAGPVAASARAALDALEGL